MLTQQGHKAWFVHTMVAHVASLTDFFRLWQRQVIECQNITNKSLLFVENSIEDPMQKQFVQLVNMCLTKRDQYYEQVLGSSNEDCYNDVVEQDDDNDLECREGDDLLASDVKLLGRA